MPHVQGLASLFSQLNSKAQEYAEKIDRVLVPSLAGEQLVHTDLRADNLLISPENQGILIDWPWACKGAAFFDAASVIVDVLATGGTYKPERIAQSSEVLSSTSSELIDLVIIAFTGYYLYAAQQPPHADTHSFLPAFRAQRAWHLASWVLDNGI
ncbi:phosphotransferase [Rothia sp. ZJ1223]|uniref:phosphotransferase n=1 Tax=Rothia sp. ZJ1223 TaxID=2811098 RepID=UPI00195A121D|nr:phosphotransferase [Rothia sp. ZJ1223]